MSLEKAGLDCAHKDESVRVQDDLYRHFNGRWLKSAVIPVDRAADGAFIKLRIQSEARVREIIEGATGSDEATKISNIYTSFMAADSVNAKGCSPIAGELAEVDSITSLQNFTSTLSKLEARGLSGIFGTFIYADMKDASSHIMYLQQGGVSLPDEAYYREEQYAPIRSALLAHIEKMFLLAGLTDGTSAAKSILELETKIAKTHWDQVKDRDATLTYNKMTGDQLKKLVANFDWPVWIKSTGTPEKVLSEVIVRQPSYFEGINELLASFDTNAWRFWLTWHLLSSKAAYLNKDLVNENFNFYGTVLSGIPQLKDRWKRAVALVEGALGEAVGQIYVERHFPPKAKERMQKLVANLIEAYRIDIKALDWMSAQTKEKALVKLEKFTPKIGYPDKWRDYSKLTIKPNNLIENIAQIAKFNQDYELSKIGSPVDKTEWFMTPQTVNAYYNPGMNEIVFPAAILQPPFFDVDADDDAANYGGIGAVIGHEIGHGFDDQGSKYDGDGNLENWWTDSDRTEFEKRADQLIKQYDQLSPTVAADVKVNGALTIGENIGDLGGLTIAYKAYQISLAGKEPATIDGFTGWQRFFLGWAQSWRGKYRPEEVRRRIAIDPHSPDEFRCNQVVANLDEFHDAFSVKSNDKHYLPKEQRVRIW